MGYGGGVSDNGLDWVWQADAALNRVNEQVRAAHERAEMGVVALLGDELGIR